MTPILWAYRTASGLMRAWCPRCRYWHEHGGEPGHRISHCLQSRNGFGDYFLEVVERAPAEIKVHNAEVAR